MGKEKPTPVALSPVLLQHYQAAQMGLLMHRAAAKAVDHVMERRALRGDPLPDADPDPPPLEQRIGRLTQLAIGTMDAAGLLTLSSYGDLYEYHEGMEALASRHLRILDEGTPELHAALEVASGAHWPHTTPAEQATEAVLCMEVRMAYRQAPPAMKKLGTHLIAGMRLNGPGIGFRRGPNGEWIIEPYYGPTALARTG